MKIKIQNSTFNKIFTILIIISILLGIGFRIWGVLNKENLHMDEAYSYGLTHYKNVQIADNEDIFFKEHKGKYFKDYLSLSKDEIGDIKQVYINQANDVHPPLYYLLLRLASLFTLNNFSIYTGSILNIFIYILTTFMIIKITKKIFDEDEKEKEEQKDEKNNVNKKRYLLVAFFIILFYSVSKVSINQVLFARMYEFLNLLTLLFMSTYIDVLKIDVKEENKEENKEEKRKYIKLGIVTILGALTHYYFAFMVVIIYLISIFFLLKKNKKELLKRITYTFIVSGIIYILIWPFSLLHIVDNGRKNDMKYFEKVKEFVKNLDFNIFILSISAVMSEVINRISKSKNVEQIKGSTEFKLNKLEEKSNLKQKNKNLKDIIYIFFFGSLIFLLVIFKLAIFIADRYIYLGLLIHIMSAIFITYLNLNENEFEDENEFETEIKNEKKTQIKANMKKYINRAFSIFLIILFILVGINTFKKLRNKELEFQYYTEKELFEKVNDIKDIPLTYLFTDEEYYSLTDDIYLLSKFDSVTVLPNNISKNAKPKAVDVFKDFSKLKRKDERIYINNNFKEDYVKYLKKGKNLILLKDEDLIKDKNFKIEKIGEIRGRKLYMVEK